MPGVGTQEARGSPGQGEMRHNRPEMGCAVHPVFFFLSHSSPSLLRLCFIPFHVRFGVGHRNHGLAQPGPAQIFFSSHIASFSPGTCKSMVHFPTPPGVAQVHLTGWPLIDTCTRKSLHTWASNEKKNTRKEEFKKAKETREGKSENGKY